ncbi:hypothetical protein YPPY08_4654 [Yersinia pestis PY-08]|uniref:Uncharacterized protein n=1 Tax=Yersinia pestis PY-08 TaxID=992134 RepID=A0AB72ZEC4_YERPE|nr:hypothetical protein YPPY08_4654 [Yersinia pestis PY-08]
MNFTTAVDSGKNNHTKIIVNTFTIRKMVFFLLELYGIYKPLSYGDNIN